MMNELDARLRELESISGELELNEKERRELVASASGLMDGFITQLPESKTYNATSANTQKLRIDGKKKTLEEILENYSSEVMDKGINAASGGHLGYIPGGGLYTSAVADYLAAASNEYAGVSYASPGAVAIENEILRWFMEIFGFPENAGGNLTSGGSIANLIALTAARDQFGIRNEAVRSGVIYLSPQAHHCIRKALRIIGLEDVVLRELQLDELGRIDVSYLKQCVESDQAEGLKPFMVIATAGTTDTGVIDPLDAIGTFAKEQGLWYHIDAAYGGFFILTGQKDKFKGIELADSIVIDPHKGLFVPYGLGAVLVKDSKALLRSFSGYANYMQDAVDEASAMNPAMVSPELSKHFRGLRLWLPLQLHGIEPFKACLEEKILLTHKIRQQLLELGFVLGPEPDLTVSYFYFPSETVDPNTFNKKLLEFIHQDGSVFLSSTIVDDRFVIRVAILSFRTKRATIDRCIEMIVEALERTKAYYE